MTPETGVMSAVAGCGLFVVLAANPPAGPAFAAWDVPVNLGPAINTSSIDAGPALSRDGLSLYFNSDRPGGLGGNDIWVAQRSSVDAPWDVPRNLGPVVNSAGLEGVPALSRDGHWLIYHSNRAGGYGNNDLWASYRPHTHDDFGWEAPVNLGAGVNSAAFDVGGALFDNEELGATLLLFGSSRPGGMGGFDIYASQLTPGGRFGAAEPVTELNSADSDQRPSVRFDGLELLLQSDRPGSVGGADLWVSVRPTVWDAWSTPQNLGALINTTATEQQPHISADRQTLLFASNRPGGEGGLDIYISTRTKIPGR